MDEVISIIEKLPVPPCLLGSVKDTMTSMREDSPVTFQLGDRASPAVPDAIAASPMDSPSSTARQASFSGDSPRSSNLPLNRKRKLETEEQEDASDEKQAATDDNTQTDTTVPALTVAEWIRRSVRHYCAQL